VTADRDDRAPRGSHGAPRPPRLGRLIVRLRRLGPRHDEIDADLTELYRERRAERGRVYAVVRHWVDAVSLWVHPPDPRPSPGLSRRRQSPLEGLLLDMRFAARMYRRQARVVSVTVFGLALAIGASTVIFGFVTATTLQRFGGEYAESVAQVRGRSPQGWTSGWWPYEEYRQLRERAELMRFEGYMRHRAPLGDAQQEEVFVTLVSGDFFETLGVRAVRGRTLTAADDTLDAPPAVVVSYGFWHRRLGGDESIVGKTVRLMGASFTVVGVIEGDFAGPIGPPAFWAPLALGRVDPAWMREPGWGLRVEVVGRVASGATFEQAEAEASALVAAVAAERLEASKSQPARADLEPVENALASSWVRAYLAIVVAALALVMLTACSNVANVLLAAALTRSREVGMRLALGASRWRLVRQLVTESIVLSAVSGVLGLLFAVWFLPLLARLVDLSPSIDVTPDIRVYGFIVISTLLSGVVAGLAPVRYGTRGDLAAPLKGTPVLGAGKPGRARSTLVGVQAAASIVLLVLAALLTRAMVHVSGADLGFDDDQLLVVSANFDAAGYDEAGAAAYWRQSIDRVERLPAVESAALADLPPFALGGGYGPSFNFPGGDDRDMVFAYRATPEYFATAGIPILRGRAYTAEEVRADASVALITDGLARRLWPDGDALGKTLDALSERLSDVRVIGVVGDAITNRLQFEARSADSIYRPQPPAERRRARLLVRVTGDPSDVIRSVHEAIRALDPEALPVVRTVRDGVREAVGPLQIYLWLALMLGAVALGLAVTGVFGLTAFAVEQRTGEIGVRVALGASRSAVMRLMLRDNLRPVVAGLALGLIVAFWASRVLTVYLFGVSPRDPAALGGAVAVLVVAAAAAAAGPTRRATEVDPVTVLRSD